MPADINALQRFLLNSESLGPDSEKLDSIYLKLLMFLFLNVTKLYIFMDATEAMVLLVVKLNVGTALQLKLTSLLIAIDIVGSA